MSTDADYIKNYDPRNYETPIVTVDVALFTLIDNELHALVVQRANLPQVGFWALPGGFIEIGNDKTLTDAAKRKLKEKTGITAPYLEQVSTFGSPDRDPRHWAVTVLYFALVPHLKTGQFLDSVSDAKWLPYAKLNKETLAFDHKRLLKVARERLMNKVSYTAIPFHVLPDAFTLSELQQAFEALLDRKMDKKSFRRRIEASELVEETGDIQQRRGRPAKLYRATPGQKGHQFLTSLQTG